MLAFQKALRYRSALLLGDGAEAFDEFYFGQYNKIILPVFPFVQGSVIGLNAELTTWCLYAETRVREILL